MIYWLTNVLETDDDPVFFTAECLYIEFSVEKLNVFGGVEWRVEA